MKFINTFRNKDGSYTSQEWSAEEMLNYDMLKYCFLAILFSMLSVFISGIGLLCKLYDYEENEKAPSFVGIVSALYFVIDYVIGLPVTFILRLFETASVVRLMAVCNLALLITHVLLLIFGDTIFYNVEKEIERKPTVVVYTLVTLGVAYLLSSLIF